MFGLLPFCDGPLRHARPQAWGPLLMLWTTPATDIAMCHIAVGVEGSPMAAHSEAVFTQPGSKLTVGGRSVPRLNLEVLLPWMAQSPNGGC